MSENEKAQDAPACRHDGVDTEMDRLEKSESIKFRYRAFGYLTFSICAVAIGSAATLLYAYAKNDRDFEEGAFGTVMNTFIEVFKIIVGMA